jgi:hypothetical protein
MPTAILARRFAVAGAIEQELGPAGQSSMWSTLPPEAVIAPLVDDHASGPETAAE